MGNGDRRRHFFMARMRSEFNFNATPAYLI